MIEIAILSILITGMLCLVAGIFGLCAVADAIERLRP